MKRQKEIKLNEFQLNALLSEEEKNGYRYLLDNGVYCNGCQGICKKGVEIKSVKLDGLNDIVVEGTCRVCGHRVARVMEFGEDPEFFEKAVNFRKSLQN
jgi:hypothetical protein